MALSAITRAGEYALRINQGSTLTQVIVIADTDGTPIDLSDVASVEAKVRDDFGSGSTVLVTLTAAVTAASSGQVTIILTSAQTAALDVPAGTPDEQREAQIGYWDLEFTTTGGEVYRYIEGACTLSREVT